MAEIGSVVSAAGQVVAILNGAERVLTAGSHVFEGEVIKTGEGASVEVRFDDETVLSQGPNSELTLDSYVYNSDSPAQSSFLFKMAQGTYRMATGQIAEDNPDGVRLESPLATIGIRGTTTVSQILPNGQELHAAESLTGGRSIILQDQFGNQQLITFTFGGVPLAPGVPMGAVITVPQSVFDTIRASAPLTSRGEAPAPGAEGGGGDDGGAAGDGADLGNPEGPGNSEVAGEGSNGEAPQGGEGDPSGPDGEGLGLGEAIVIDLIGTNPLAEALGFQQGFIELGDSMGDELGGSSDPNDLLDALIDQLVNLSDAYQNSFSGFGSLVDEFDTLPPSVVVPPVNVSGVNVIKGNDSSELLVGTNGADSILGYGGNDIIVGSWGKDVLIGGLGDDTLYGAGTGAEASDRLNDIGTVSYGNDSLEDGTFARIDGDRFNDVVLLAKNTDSESTTLLWYKSSYNASTHSLSFSEPNIIKVFDNDSSEKVLAVADIDKDGDMDILVGTADGNLIEFQNQGGGIFQEQTLDSLAGGVSNIVVADFDGDGDNDIVIRGIDGIAWYENGEGDPKSIISEIGSSVILEVAELNGEDGDYQEVITKYGLVLKCYYHDGTGWKYSVIKDDFSGTEQGVVLGDSDGDGDKDLFLYSDDNLSMYLNTDGTFVQSQVSFAPVGTIQSIALGNFIGNGDLDLLVATASNLYIYHNVDDAQGFEKIDLLAFTGGETIDGVMVGDFDGDGQVDDVVIHFNDTPNTAVVYENLLSEAEGNTVNYQSATQPVSVTLRDTVAGSASGGDDSDTIYLVDNITGSNASDLYGFGDTLTGNNYDNKIFGLAGNDTIMGLGGDDTLDGGTGMDSIEGGVGNDSILGGDGNDTIYGDASDGGTVFGDDTISGGAGSDEIYGGGWDDVLLGNTGNDNLFGDDGNDTLWGGLGQDSLEGGLGNDTFYYSSVAEAGDTVNDFTRSKDVFTFLSSQFGSSGQHGVLSGNDFIYWVKADHGNMSFMDANPELDSGQTYRFVFDETCGSNSGQLYYESAAGKVMIAEVNVDGGPLEASDIYLVNDPYADLPG
ncbi:FG-GAP-like repeat-containing protein [Desulfovibrio mangrovi]|uniref:FG-GAP-like repeat-containing protein n=1 Tax=Desulfovibrio mangrovi TaxID=2976983 RepID=UPI0022466DF2|nr:FG-GAP-like repeat-containing protein [Desulfovibrio mangrovi]UZP68832.1 FG-GAP-like repeat-containing protein [Desulfovibrio mangrovi]